MAEALKIKIRTLCFQSKWEISEDTKQLVEAFHLDRENSIVMLGRKDHESGQKYSCSQPIITLSH